MQIRKNRQLGDVDNDGWVDLYRTASGPNQLFRNNGDGTFTDRTQQTGTASPWFTASASFVDIDRDGWLDLYVANYFDQNGDGDYECSVGTGERDYCGPERYLSVPDRLYRNRGDGTFVDVTAEAQVAGEYGLALGVLAADLDVSFFRYKKIRPASLMKVVEDEELVWNFKGTEFVVAGAGVGVSGKKSRQVKKFWKKYFEKSGASVLYYGPIFLGL